jgi:hypothetical protein
MSIMIELSPWPCMGLTLSKFIKPREEKYRKLLIQERKNYTSYGITLA